MTLFELMGKIVIENGSANAAIDETTNKAQQLASNLSGTGSGSVSGAAASMGSKVANAASKVGTTVANAAKTVGKVALAGTATAAAGVTALTKQAVSAYAENEQLVGGIETLFKDSADTVKEYADEAYKTAGLSANEYMETVTSFSASLLQSLDWNTEEAADLANQAIIDMSDNANKMGTDMTMIQNAYQGFAKQNYTMLDNLKLGYGGTQQEMYRLLQDAQKLDETFDADFSLDSTGHLDASFADILEAIHIVQNEMGITGTTALEAEQTISGSWSSLKGAWENTLVGLADEDADLSGLMGNLASSAGTFLGDNLIPRIGEIFSGIKDAAPEITESLAPVLSEALSGSLELVGVEIKPEEITNFFGTAFEKVGDIGQVLGGAGGKVGTALKNAFNDIFDSMAEEGLSVDGLFDAIGKGIENGGDAVAGIVETLGGMISDNMDSFFATGENIGDIVTPIVESINTQLSEYDFEGAFGGAAKLVEEITGAIAGTLNSDVGEGTLFTEVSSGINDVFLAFQSGKNHGISDVVEDLANYNEAMEKLEKLNLDNVDMSGAFAKIKQQLMDGEKTLGEVASGVTAALSGILSDVDMGVPNFGGVLGAAAAVAEQIKSLFADAMAEGSTTHTSSSGREHGGSSGSFGNSTNSSGASKTTTNPDLVPSVDDPYGVMNLNADGAIFSKATIFGRAAGKLQVAGEAGAEAVAPIDVLQGYVSEAVAAQNQGIFEMMAQTIETMREYTENVTAAIENSMQNVTIKVGKREFGRTVKEVGASV